MKTFQRILVTSAPASVLLIRLIVGAVFLSEGIQKFLFPADLGVGRFVKIGIPAPQVTAPFVGVVEIVCGGLIMLGLLTRFAAIPLNHRYLGGNSFNQNSHPAGAWILAVHCWQIAYLRFLERGS